MREPDIDKLAGSLLDLVNSLTPEEQDHFAAIGERMLKQIKAASPPKGRAQ
jgi:hypothetical protein